MIQCEKCGEDINVIDSRTTNASYLLIGVLARRRRACKNCGHRFTTFEVTEDVVKTLISNSAKLKLFSDLMTGRQDFNKIPKLDTMPKALRYFGEEKKPD